MPFSVNRQSFAWAGAQEDFPGEAPLTEGRSPPVDSDRRRWLEGLAEVCERVLAEEDGDSADAHYAEIRTDIRRLLTDIRAELDGATPS